jgi:hypothetical protein
VGDCEVCIFSAMNNNFTNDEWQFLNQEQPMKLKQGIFKKLDQILWDTHKLLLDAHAEKLAIFQEWRDLPIGSARIFKGENYQGLPWIALDSFSSYNKDKTLLFRILIVWGQGAFLNFLAEKDVANALASNSFGNHTYLPVFILKSENLWIQHLDLSQGEIVLEPQKAKQLRQETGYTRLISHIPFDKMDNFHSTALNYFENQLNWMQFILQPPNE